MTIETLALTNWQTHQQDVFEFDPHLTTIVGSTDSGKSSLLRALQWICLNQFDGPANAHVSWDANHSKIVLCVDGRKVTRRKGRDGSNSYHLDRKEFKAFGAEVPDEIVAFLAVGSDNFQGQFDDHFWLASSGGQISRELNAIINLSSIDDALSQVAAVVRETTQAVKHTINRLHSATTARKAYSWVRKANKRLSDIEALSVRRNALLTQKTRLTELLAKACKQNAVAKPANRVLDAFKELSITKTTLDDLTQRTGHLRDLITRLAGITTTLTIPDPPSPDEIDATRTRTERLRWLVFKIGAAEEIHTQTTTYVGKIQKRLNQLTEGGCPVCGQPIKSLP